MGMDISRYNHCEVHTNEVKAYKVQDGMLPTVSSDSGADQQGGDVAGRMEFWPPGVGVADHANKHCVEGGIDLCGSVIHGNDALDQMLQFPKAGDVRSWRDLTGASRTNSESKAFRRGVIGGRLGHHMSCPCDSAMMNDFKGSSYLLGKSFRIGVGESEDVDGSVEGRQGEAGLGRWEEAATSQNEGDPHAQFNVVQEEELSNRVNDLCSQGDRSNEHRLQEFSRDMIDECNMVGIDLRRRNHPEDLDGLDLREAGLKGVSRDCDPYAQCQKNTCVARGPSSVDRFTKFLSSGKDEKLALTCPPCGCHRNFHQRVVDACEEGEEEELTVKAKREKLNSGNYFSSFVDHCNIDRVAHELMAVANEALALAQDSICHGEGRGLPENGVYSVEEHTIIAKISLENLDHITKVISSTTECLTLLRKRKSVNPRDKDVNKSKSCPHEGGPFSTDASPVITVENGAISLLVPPSPGRQFREDAIGGSPTLIISESCGIRNCNLGMPRKLPLERVSHKLKRTRTRISLEQREKLNAFAEKAGWTVVGQRKETIDATCQYIGIEPKTLKYWIHNSKQKWKRQPSLSEDPSK
ncbi:uncharacterized protein [Physcomitrium patens]|uniref:Homeobox domain-containing protein n=1 Tax=Physcomitrium patens TaxID=3218 RepID=A0A2K1JVR2_PHYPA|nr:uncharacterized protein LOC112288433 [Physcomitrium patens]PNR45621.1 hypothetical protein PHYPA_015392 [Physcomitrium patens]|eukprot:XP_024388356.1 uncharacterized protein LOC112288433 [Physcomitrella patens]